MIKLIIFDLGGVITSSKIEKLDSYIASFLKISTPELKKIIKKYKDELSRGEINLLYVYSKVLEKLNRKDLTAAEILKEHFRIYRKILGKLNKPVLHLINKLKEKYQVVCLTNAELEIVPIARHEIKIYDYFEKAYISVEMKMKKPEPRIYKKVLEDYKCQPASALFIDDNKKYVKVAKELGMKGIHFKNIRQLKKELANFRILI